MKIRLLLSLISLTIAVSAGLSAQEPPKTDPTVVAIFPFKNLYGHVKYDSLAWSYADSLYLWLAAQPGNGTTYQIIPTDDIRDQMLAMNVDVKSPSYETDVWKIAGLLGAKKLIWGTYLVKYEKANIEVKVYEMKTLMYDPVNMAEKIRIPYEQALQTVATVGTRIIGGLP